MDEAKLSEIRAFESEANQIVDNAKAEYHKIIADADLQGAEYFEAEKQKCKDEVKRILSRYKEEGQKEAEGILSELGRATDDIQNKANPNWENALKTVIGIIKNK